MYAYAQSRALVCVCVWKDCKLCKFASFPLASSHKRSLKVVDILILGDYSLVVSFVFSAPFMR